MEGIFTFFGVISENHTFLFVSHMFLAALLTLIVAKLATKRLQVVPTGCQNVMEAYLEGVVAMGRDVIGESYAKKYLPLVATLGLFIFFANLMEIIPGFEPPSGNINFTLALALIVFIYYNFEGIRKNGVIHYFAHFAGPVKLLAPLMFPIEIVSHISRIISLSFRLFGNIKGDDLFVWVLLMLAPWIVPLPGFALMTFSAFLQTFIFMILTYVYLAGAVLLHEESL
ncbi:F0F1 ATP synthase subunit A [Nitratiruptor sp. SB155-2]|uniref:ATP synthase subunit a n=1 Tax=Nitratiruptor sp. (strain SB155-2) TaxID=387092 RepID=ATP6_NITSB|nr:F0F1 ATP synthase subunit A [Nitratiruptor sp. SB155-2]A6Q3A6.1 RecName: Full=ATP synthase subunit a; AltName: Full=ATP synthase F0 sector subunit a; AltName: Full=F-ATPase subunit 6 [Nitratiruptor sp. SB155-2]BAF69965.1 F0F1-type ATP synthase, A subunit [Nitratiruptor sp. SB155-2]